VWFKVLSVAVRTYPLGTPPNLIIDTSTGQINALAYPAQNEVHIFLNLAELISDSESELAFVVAHELGHIIQARLGRLALVPGNAELDADQYGMLLSLVAGYDPYGAAGALAKLAMASGSANLVAQNFDALVATAGLDLHGSFNNRLALIFQNMQTICALPQLQTFCAQYKSVIHPHLPSIAPLDKVNVQ
jgi:predicted Zn-dependent protease